MIPLVSETLALLPAQLGTQDKCVLSHSFLVYFGHNLNGGGGDGGGGDGGGDGGGGGGGDGGVGAGH